MFDFIKGIGVYWEKFEDYIRFILFRRRMIKIKNQLKLEGLMDKYFIEHYYAETLSYDDAEDRKELGLESQKEPKDKDMAKMQKLQEKIADGKAIKQTYRKTLVMLDEIDQYIEAIKTCQKLN